MKSKAAFFLLFFLFYMDNTLAWRIPTPWGDAKGDDPGEVIENTGGKLREIIEAPGKAPGMVWEGVTNPFREVFAQTGYAGLQEWIAQSRDDAIRSGVSPIPPHIYQKLRAYYPDHLLNKVRYRIGASGDLALQRSVFNLGNMSAIALDYVIVFRDAEQARINDKLWAHEVAHIDQYQSWGIRDFAIKYLRDFSGVENEANQRADEYQRVSQQQIAPAGVIPVQQPIMPGVIPVQEVIMPATPVRFCRTNWGTCPIPPANAPMGSPCFCVSGYGNQLPGQAF